MTMRIPQWILASLLIIASPLASAYMEATGIVPASPVAGEVVSVHIREGGCDAIIESEGYPVVTQSGQHIRILFDTIHSTDFVFCNIPPAEADWRIGEFAPGDYILQVDRHYLNIFGDVISTVGTLNFTVTAPTGSAIAIPALNFAGLTLLGGIIALTGCWRRRFASRCLIIPDPQP